MYIRIEIHQYMYIGLFVFIYNIPNNIDELSKTKLSPIFPRTVTEQIRRTMQDKTLATFPQCRFAAKTAQPFQDKTLAKCPQ